MFIDINDLRINYIDEGEDNGRGVILLLHGWGSNITLFKNIVDMLSPHMRVVAPDMAKSRGALTIMSTLSALSAKSSVLIRLLSSVTALAEEL